MANVIHPDLIRIALDRTDGNSFELFGKEFLSAQFGIEFVPTGGMHDGGADGFFGDSVWQSSADAQHFVQISIREDLETKIRATVKRLREDGRDPKRLTYVTQQRVAKPDHLEILLGRELEVALQIRDEEYLIYHVNDSPGTRAAYQHYLEQFTAFLMSLGSSATITTSAHTKTPAVYVFLQQELDRRAGDTSLVDALVDGLVVWALEGTDPDENRFMTRDQVEARISAELPAVKSIVHERLEARLESLSSKSYPGGRAIRWHRKDDLFCLPYSTRQTFASENAHDAALKLKVEASFEDRIRHRVGNELGTGTASTAAKAAMRAVELMFETRGLEFASFLAKERSTEAPLTLADRVDEAMSQMGMARANRDKAGEAILQTLREAIYSASDDERELFGKLARTYCLLFALKAEPRVVSYFQELTGDFYLYVGADVLVKALSERYLPKADQMYRNALSMARDAGAKLVLAEPVLEEVVQHLRLSDSEFRELFAGMDDEALIRIALQSGRILIRAYFYARERAADDCPKSWNEFVDNFCTPSQLHYPQAHRQLQLYLSNEFGMTYESRTELEKLVNREQVKEIASALQNKKSHPQLAENDALLALAVYGRRDALGESAPTTEFGYRTWWLTGESAIQRHTSEVVASHFGDRYMMRPEFLVNFIALVPTAAEVRRTYANVFPSALGVQLARHVGVAEFDQMMEEVRACVEMEEGRRKSRMIELSDRLKTTFQGGYSVTWHSDSAPRQVEVPVPQPGRPTPS